MKLDIRHINKSEIMVVFTCVVANINPVLI